MRNPIKKIVPFSFFLLVFLGWKTVLGQYDWSGTVRISSGNNPDMVIDRRTGNLHVVSVKNGVVYVKKDSTAYDLIRETIPLTNREVGEYHFGPSVAVDIDGNPHVCYREYDKATDTYDLYYTWRDSIDWLVPFKLSQNVPRGYVVRMAVDSQNRVHVAQSSESEKWLAPWGNVTYFRIVNGMRDKTEMITNPDLKQYRVDNRFELDANGDGTVYLILGVPDTPQGPVLYFRSDDAGDTWNFIADIHTTETHYRNGSPDIFLDQAGNIHFCYGAKSDLSIGGTPSVRYVRYQGNWLMRHIPVNENGELESWHGGEGWGLGTVASSADGKYVGIAYLTKNIGQLYTRFSSDAGATWSEPSKLSNSAGNYDGRSVPVMRAYRNHFYIVYPNNITPVGSQLRLLRDVGDFPPTAHTGGPYSGFEGSPFLLDMSASLDEGQNAGIIEYAWDWDRDGLYDFITGSPSDTYTFNDDFEGEVIFRITDRIGQTDLDTTWITVDNVPPSVFAGPDTSCNEGDTLSFSVQITDPGSEDTHLIIWDFGDFQFGDVTELEYCFPNDSLYSIVVTVTDKDGGIGRDTIEVTVLNVPPVAEAGGPYHGIPLDTVRFTGNGWDSGIEDSLSYSWDLDNDLIFESQGQNVTGVFQENGVYLVRLKVEDEDGGAGYDSAEVTIANFGPAISPIPDQIINEGEYFESLVLDDFVEDLEHGDDVLTWSYSGNTDLILTLEDRILSVATPDSNWFGEEMIQLEVEDPLHVKDSTEVLFTVLAVNDAPWWSARPDTHFLEDDTLHLPIPMLQSMVIDVDDLSEELRFSISGNTSIEWLINTTNQTMDIFVPKNWYGMETLFFVVTDTSGATGEIQSTLTVDPVPDPPDYFGLSAPADTTFTEWPDSIQFRWYSSSDPDSGDVIYYVWSLSNPGGSAGPILRISPPLQDTTYTFLPDSALEDGIYLWWVTAYDLLGHSRDTNPRGIFVGVSDVEIPTEQTIPSEFALLQNYPNPFNPETHIIYCLPEVSPVRLMIYNTLGQMVRSLDAGRKNAGIYTVTWDGRDSRGVKVNSGIYLCRLEAGKTILYRKMMLIR